jgi:methylmalonyl-CoA mutase
MGDVQEYFIKKNENFYSVSISGIILLRQEQSNYTITLSNGFTYVEYYLSRGMSINDLDLIYPSFSNVDPEYAVGRVARKIWAKAMKINMG